MKPTVYIETTIPSYYCDDREELLREILRTRQWWDAERQEYECFCRFNLGRKAMSDSPIVEEVRQRAMEISSRYGHDLDRYFDHLREYQRQFADRLVSQITVVPARRAEKPASK